MEILKINFKFTISDEKKNTLISKIESKKTVNTDIKNPKAEEVIAKEDKGKGGGR